MKVTYSEGRKPVSIKYKTMWNLGNIIGLSFIKVRAIKNRYGYSKGNTFQSIHIGKYSFHRSLSKPTKELWFKKFVKIGETNKTMKILEVTY
jgi:hypothetical protein|tara:strand:+ start:411 stop:686 length:276 start_codon:yes stop_codon:yes gene_type:complete